MPTHRSLRRLAASTLVAAWVLAAVGPAVGEVSPIRVTPIVTAVQAAGPAVVNIQGQKLVGSQASGSDAARPVNGMGTGVVIDPRGYILTNHHVVDGVRQINVTLSRGQAYTARLVAHDKRTDLAVIKVRTGRELPVIPIGTSSDLMAGESVIAVGNAFGYEHTVTRG
ncbi:MAG: trypsin-like peptidase domain-containing protein, partial [Planctomycetota bacterium]